ncbi:MAG: hypothetical protein KQA41_04720 [Candidatus Aenigmarchaeota archaeon]|nr:hypothetical protein [Candidatus Aenigmarchaeota archaeon]
MKKYYIIAVLLIVIATVKADNCYLQVKLLNQDPYPAEPGNYVKIVFEVTGIENPTCNGASLKIMPEYPFYLDQDSDSVQTIKGGYISEFKTSWLAGYKLRVDKNALTGDYQLKIQYQPGQKINENAIQKTFPIKVEDVQTKFDVIVQDQSSNIVSLGIINVGKNTANSVIVKIPEQENFMTTGISEQIIGNLAAGDYTLVSFDIMPKKNTSRISNELTVQIDYTDILGERRSTTKNVNVVFRGNTTLPFVRSQQFRNSQNQTRFQWYYIVAALAAVVTIYIFIKKIVHKKKDQWTEKIRKK